MIPAGERATINRFLGNRGLAQLTEPGALVQQLAFCVQDHDQLQRLLVKCQPEERRNMFESLRPHLHFEPKPLDVYMAEAAQSAEARQLPVVAEDGTLRPFRAPHIKSDEYIATEAIKREMAKHHLTVTCAKCTVQGQFNGVRRADAVADAREAGWAYDEVAHREICPKCLAN